MGMNTSKYLSSDDVSLDLKVVGSVKGNID